MRVFLDANILFSGSNPHSNLSRFLCHLMCDYALVTSGYAALEAERNLMGKRPQWQDGYVKLLGSVEIVREMALNADVSLAEKDRPVLGAAIGARCSHLLTGDKRDFGHLYGEVIGGVLIVDMLSLAGIVFGTVEE